MPPASRVTSPNGYLRAQCDRIIRCTTVGLSDATQKSGQRLSSLGGLYIWLPPAILELLEFKNITPTPKNISKPSKSLVIISLAFSTYLRVLVLD